jgi:hypothetical protein
MNPAASAEKHHRNAMNTFIDEGIAHIARVMRPALYGEMGGSYLPSAYWRQRLYQILDTTHLSNGQLRKVDSLLLELDEYDLCNKLPVSNPQQLQIA